MLMQEEGVLKGQELENALSDADYSKAIQIAFELRRPHRLFELFAELCRLAVIFFLLHKSFWHTLDLTDISAGRERLKITLTERLRAWVMKSFGYYLTTFENGIQNQSSVMFPSLCFSEFSTSFLQHILFRCFFILPFFKRLCASNRAFHAYFDD